MPALHRTVSRTAAGRRSCAWERVRSCSRRRARKNISGPLNQIEAGRIRIHTFMNPSAFTVADVDMKIISIQFATSEEDKGAQFFGQVYSHELCPCLEFSISDMFPSF